jgi:hypothetical protein
MLELGATSGFGMDSAGNPAETGWGLHRRSLSGHRRIVAGPLHPKKTSNIQH